MTIFYRKRKELVIVFWFFVFLLIGVLLHFNHSVMQEQAVLAQETLNMYSGSYALTDGNTDRLLVGKNETEPMANASTTKILTCIITLENCSLDELVTVSANAASQPKVRLGMREGQQYPLRDMLYGLMLESYNDCAVAIAEHVSGSVENFANLMNEKAKEIGCTDTYFITPNGLDGENEGGFHHTTAVDLCKIMAYCTWDSPMNDIFLEITQTKNYTGSANGNSYSFVNRNVFLDQMEGVLSGKTGFTAKAGYCYVAALEQNGERYCISLLACGWPNNKTYKWHDARALFQYGLEKYSVEHVGVESIVKEIEVDGCVGEPYFPYINQTMTLQVANEGKEYEVLLSENESLETEIILYTDTELPIEKGQVMGVCNVYLENLLIDSIELYANEDSDRWTMEQIMELILLQFLTFSS